MTRRTLLVLPAALPLLGAERPAEPPRNASFPLRTVTGLITPVDQFFIRDHFNVPALSLPSWRLSIEGRVEQPFELSFADILEWPSLKREVLLECAGNIAGGSAVSNGDWEGVLLSQVLARAKPQNGADRVLLEAADRGRLTSASPEMQYGQLVPLTACQAPETLLAFRLNGAYLTRQHGFPLRAIFPGRYAMDSVKWLQRIIVLNSSDRPGDFVEGGMHQLYNRVESHPDGTSTVTRLAGLQVKSAIAFPSDNLPLPPGPHTIRGFAWTGAGTIRTVLVSLDAGRNWQPAQLDSVAKPYAWVRWNFAWTAEPGDYILQCRATDNNGREQPLRRDALRKDGYELNYTAAVRCAVR